MVLSGLVCFVMTGCSHVLWQAAQLPGLSGISQRMNERAFIREITGSPSNEVAYRVRHGQYQFKGLVVNSSNEQWVPGLIPNQYSVYQVVWMPVIPGEERTTLAEKYYREFNVLMLEARRGVKLDNYGSVVR